MPPLPGPLTAVRVLVGLSIAGYVGVVVLGVVALVVLSSIGPAVIGSWHDAGGPTLAAATRFLTVVTVFAVIAAVADGWAVFAVIRRSRVARTVITLVDVADLVVGLTGFSVLDVPTMVGVLVVGLPFNLLLVALLWWPASCRAWFDGRTTVPASIGVTRREAYDDPTARTDVLVLPPRRVPR